MILCIVQNGGLCNRMRTMAGVIGLSKMLNQKVVFVWINKPDMNIFFHQLFEDFPYTVIDLQRRGRVFKILDFLKKHWRGKVIDDTYVRENCKQHINEHIGNLLHKNLLIDTCENITLSIDFSIFHPLPSLIAQRDARIDGSTIGVHIRRLDNVLSIKYSPTELFVHRMKQEIEQNPSVYFYLATDSLEEERTLKDIFGGRIICFAKRSLDRNNPDGIEDALIELYNLSRCKKIIGSYYSSFSDTAAYWGNIPKEIVTIERNSKKED